MTPDPIPQHNPNCIFASILAVEVISAICLISLIVCRLAGII